MTRTFRRRGCLERTSITISLSLATEARAQEVALALDRIKAHAAVNEMTFSECLAQAILRARRRKSKVEAMTDWLNAEEVRVAKVARNLEEAHPLDVAGWRKAVALEVLKAIAALPAPVDRIRTEPGFDEQVELERIWLVAREVVG